MILFPSGQRVSSLSSGRYVCDFKGVNFKHNLSIAILSIQVNIILEWIS